MKTHTHNLWPLYVEYICKTQIDIQPLIDVQSSNLLPFLHFANRRPITSLTDASTDVTPVEAMMEKRQNQFPDELILDGKKKEKKYMTLH